MNIQEILKKYTNEEGVVDYASAQAEIDGEVKSQVTKQVGAVISKKKQKQQKTVEKVEINTNEYKTQLDELTNELNKMREAQEEKKRSEFFSKGKKLGIEDSVLNAFENSGADISKIDLDDLVQKAKADLPDVNQNESEDSQISQEKEIKELVDEAKKKF